MEDMFLRVYVEAPSEMEEELLKTAYENYSDMQADKKEYKIVNMSKYNIDVSSSKNLSQVTLAVEAMEYAENYN